MADLPQVIVAVASPIYTSLAITLLWVGYYQYLAAKAVRQGRSILKVRRLIERDRRVP
jgi:hypothetical protein